MSLSVTTKVTIIAAAVPLSVIMVTVWMPYLSIGHHTSERASLRHDLLAISYALQQYHLRNGSFPASGSAESNWRTLLITDLGLPKKSVNRKQCPLELSGSRAYTAAHPRSSGFIRIRGRDDYDEFVVAELLPNEYSEYEWHQASEPRCVSYDRGSERYVLTIVHDGAGVFREVIRLERMRVVKCVKSGATSDQASKPVESILEDHRELVRTA